MMSSLITPYPLSLEWMNMLIVSCISTLRVPFPIDLPTSFYALEHILFFTLFLYCSIFCLLHATSEWTKRISGPLKRSLSLVITMEHIQSVIHVYISSYSNTNASFYPFQLFLLRETFCIH